ncbi:MAG: flagellar biosynthesis protein FlhB [Chrysiogenales bacterium]|nr:MAG: flagellar biosynthesis protein FlhB [Chrysiogenales bacterium]
MKDENVGVALEYSGDLPKVVAVARGLLYDRLIQLAREHDITIYHDPDLAETLSHLPRGSEIPEALFIAVSEVLAHCYRVNSGFKEKLDDMGIV